MSQEKSKTMPMQIFVGFVQVVNGNKGVVTTTVDLVITQAWFRRSHLFPNCKALPIVIIFQKVFYR